MVLNNVVLTPATVFAGCGRFSDSPPLPACQQQQQSAARQLFEEEAPLPGRREDIASRHKGSSISFGWGGSPPDQRRKAAAGFKTPGAKPSEQQTVHSSARKPSAGLLVGLATYIIYLECSPKGLTKLSLTKLFCVSDQYNLLISPYLPDDAGRGGEAEQEIAETRAGLARLERVLQGKEGELSTARLDLAAAESELEQLRGESRKQEESAGRQLNNTARLQADLDTQTNMVR